jgi:acetyltransferase-like isoleucine patch superfamily enzyme
VVEPVKICAGATIAANVTVGPYAIVGEGARVERSITRTIVWAGAVASAANASETIIT